MKNCTSLRFFYYGSYICPDLPFFVLQTRSKFTLDTVVQSSEEYPNFNFDICYTEHTTQFVGDRGVDWSHSHHEVDMTLGGIMGSVVALLKSYNRLTMNSC